MILIGIGANLPSPVYGSAIRTIDEAVRHIEAEGIKLIKKSRIWLSDPVPKSDQPWYVNAVVSVETQRLPIDLLRTLLAIEQKFGRVRSERNAARVLDLDVIAYHDMVMDEQGLTLPHPRMAERAFVLRPLSEIDKNWVHPVLRQPLSDLLQKLPSDQQAFPFLPIGPVLMGVLNVTPDSFSDGGDFEDPQAAIDHGLSLIEEGAQILDIGGESTRPGSVPVNEQVEINRIMPVIEGLRSSAVKSRCLISVDTRRAKVMTESLNAGANFINDISALSDDSESMSVILRHHVPVCLMHKQGQPESMQEKPFYNNVLEEVVEYLDNRINALVDAGLPKSFIIADPGIGFGKTVDHNVDLLRGLEVFQKLSVPLLVGTSRKSFITNLDRQASVRDRLGGSLASVLHALDCGAKILRVHDIAATRQAIAVWQALRPSRVI